MAVSVKRELTFAGKTSRFYFSSPHVFDKLTAGSLRTNLLMSEPSYVIAVSIVRFTDMYGITRPM